MSTKVVYHYSDTMRLPWIIESGELWSRYYESFGLNLLWATSKPDGDSGIALEVTRWSPDYRDGLVKLVRFTVVADRFIPWRELERGMTWSARQLATIKRLKALGKGVTDLTKCHCRFKALPITAALQVEVRGYRGRWKPINATPANIFKTNDPNTKGFIIGSEVYLATQNMFSYRHYQQPTRFDVSRASDATFMQDLEDQIYYYYQETLGDIERWGNDYKDPDDDDGWELGVNGWERSEDNDEEELDDDYE